MTIGIFGRAAELDRLNDLLTAAAGGVARLILVEGEPGIGKTRLVEEAVDRFAGAFRAHRGATEELERDRPFGALFDALDIQVGSSDRDRLAIAELLHSAGDDETEPRAGLRYQILDRVLALLEGESRLSPLLLVLEDLQWADPSTALAPHYLRRRLAELPIAVVVTARPVGRRDPSSKVIDRLAEVADGHLILGPLDPSAVDSLALQVLGSDPGPQLREQLRAANGNPLFVIELIGALEAEGAIRRVDGAAEIIAAKPPRTLGESVLRRLGVLPGISMDLLRHASVLGSSFSLGDLAVALGRPAVELAPLVEESIQSHVIEARGDVFSFRHDVVRDSIYEGLPFPVRKGLHREIGRRLAKENAGPRKVALHLSLGADEGDEEALGWLLRAASESADAFPTATVEILEQALAVAGPTHSRRRELLIRYMKALNWAGRSKEAEDLARDLLTRSAGAAEDVLVRKALADALLLQGRWQQAVLAYEAVAAAVPRDDVRRTEALAEAALASVFAVGFDRARDLAGEALSRGQEQSDDLAVCIAKCALSALAVFHGDLRDGTRLSSEALELARSSDDRRVIRRDPHFFSGITLMEADRFAEAEAVMHSGHRLGEELGLVWNLPLFNFALASVPFWRGDWDEAVRELEAGLTLAQDVATRWGVVMLHSVLAYIAVHRDDLQEAAVHLEEADRELERGGSQFGTEWLMWARSLHLEATGAREQAYVLLQSAWDMAAAMGIVNYHRVIGADLIRMAVAAGDVERLGSALIQIDEVTGRMGTTTARGTAEWCRGLADQDPTAFRKAVEIYRESPRRFEFARLCEDAAATIWGSGSASEGSALFVEALELYEQIDANRDVSRIIGTMRRVGIRRARKGSRRRERTGWSSLTDTELRVVDMVAAGRSNPQIADRLFISRRTVESHVSSALRKLGVSSRVGIATIAARRAQP